jgi:hypothetical protein
MKLQSLWKGRLPPATSKASLLRVVAALFAFTLFFYWKILFTNRAMFVWDAVGFFYPYLSFVHEELRHFRFPLWIPYALSGYPIIADPEAQIFYPINWLFVVVNPFSPLPFKLVEIQIILHFFLAGLFMYLLARDFTREAVSALLGAVVFMSSGAMVAHTEHMASVDAMAWYPLVFLLARRGLLEGKFVYTISAGVVFGLENLTGHAQHAVYLGLFLFLYFAYEACAGAVRSQLWPRWIYQLITIAAVGAGLALVQLLPAYELSTLSIRAQLTYSDVTAGNDPQYLWTLLLPNYFGGLNGVLYLQPVEPSANYVFLTVPGCLLAVLGLIEMMRRGNFFWIISVLLFTELSFGGNGHLAEVLFRIPVLNLFRQMVIFFDLANFVLCLMAAVGAHTLFCAGVSNRIGQWLTIALIVLPVSLAGFGFLVPGVARINGWYHMLAVLALFCVLGAVALHRKKLRPVALWTVLGVVVFQLCYYSMNQNFNFSPEDPRTTLAYDYAVGRKETLEFLRSDPVDDFRVAAFAESPWSSNGWNVWRIPGIYGWNPIMLQSYGEYIRQFTHYAGYARPFGGPDHRLESPMLDLLGVKYLVAMNPVEEEQRLAQSSKFERVFRDNDWLNIYRNQDYLSRAWFYPRVYVVPDQAVALALMNSDWFHARRTLVVAKKDLGTEGTELAEELSSISLGPDRIAASSRGRVAQDSNCAVSTPLFTDWGRTGDWMRFNVAGPPEPGRYLLLLEYAAAGSIPPALAVEVSRGDSRLRSGRRVLPRTYNWACADSRSADLGEFEIAPGMNQITLTAQENSAVNLYTLRLVRLPAVAPPEPGAFTFKDSSYEANRISFTANLPQDGFVLLNEIHYPGWEAAVDSKPVKILRADGIFRALYVPAGSHSVELRFWPRNFSWGAAVSLITLVSYLVYMAAYRRKKKRSGHELHEFH